MMVPFKNYVPHLIPENNLLKYKFALKKSKSHFMQFLFSFISVGIKNQKVIFYILIPIASVQIKYPPSSIQIFLENHPYFKNYFSFPNREKIFSYLCRDSLCKKNKHTKKSNHMPFIKNDVYRHGLDLWIIIIFFSPFPKTVF